MKNRFFIPSLIALGVTAFSMGGCSFLNPPQEETTESTTTVEDVDKDFSIGAVKDKTYTNEFFGLKLTVADDWSLLNEKEIAEITSTVKDNISDDEIKEAINSGDTRFIMYAMKNDKTQNVNITVQKLPYSTQLADFDINAYVDNSVEQTKELLPQNGFENLDVKKTEITFLSEKVPAIHINAKYKGNDIHETQVYCFKGSYMASITATSSGADTTEGILNTFEKI